MEFVTKTVINSLVIVQEQVSVAKIVKSMFMIACLIPVTVMEVVLTKSMALVVNVKRVMMGITVKTILTTAFPIIPVRTKESV